jgi:single-stranded-DNA-specific exonuclease
MSLSLSGTRWVLKDADPDLVATLSTDLQVSPSVARCLAVRGVTSPEQGRLLLHPTADAFHDPFSMHGMTAAVARLQQAVAANESIRAVTDYDVDGTTSSLILQGVLRILGAKRLSYHIPDRMDEGYGFSVRAAEQAAADGVSLILTADIGVKDHASVTRARELGVDVIICDHHLPPDADVPSDATVVLCPPQKSCSYPNPHLAACGVSFKLAQALLADHPKRDAILRSLLKLVAIGTVADVVDLRTPENRAIVSLGLAALNEGPHKPGLAALLQASGLTPGEVTSTDLGFRIGPRINAAGRMASATAVVELLSTADPARAQSLAQDLERMNLERRRVQDQIQDLAMAQVTDPAPPMILVHGSEQSGWHRGVTGIVAARIRDRFHRPCAVVAVHGEEAVASVRSTPEVHAVHMLDAASDLLLRYGGHPAAAGFSVRTEHIDALAERLSAAALEQTGGTIPTPSRSADLQLDPTQLDRGLLDSLARLAPHGKGNPSPRIWISPTQVQDVRVLKEKHLKLRVGGAGAGLDVLWWGAAEHEDLLRTHPQVELLGSLSLNKWRGRETLQMTLDDVRMA